MVLQLQQYDGTAIVEVTLHYYCNSTMVLLHYYCNSTMILLKNSTMVLLCSSTKVLPLQGYHGTVIVAVPRYHHNILHNLNSLHAFPLVEIKTNIS